MVRYTKIRFEKFINPILINLDFIIIEQNILLRDKSRQTIGSGGHNKKLVLLTSDCFKMLCMRSKTKKAEKVREYYIKIEKLIDEYKDIIIEENNKKIRIL